ncbi:MAG: DNA-processing protein DprA [Clostridia bacterium]|nr:DNA-processing protein DprA [Clostridia bacterium]
MIFINIRLHNVLSLNLAFGEGSQRAVKTYQALSQSNRLDVTLEKSLADVGIGEEERNKLLKIKRQTIIDIIDECKKENIRIIPIYDSDYPGCLRNIQVPPLVLFVKGVLPNFDEEPTFCIVGPRNITEFGKRAAYSLARRLAKSGMIIVGGTASGGDYSVHTGTLSAGGRSVMVTADGIITQMNSKNYKLCENILKNGCIISEKPPKYTARKFSFPLRNRIMSGLSLGVAVVEAPEKSGTLITANHALDQGKDVFVVPGKPTDKAYKGSNELLRDGAIPLIDASDIFSRYVIRFCGQISIRRAYDDQSDKKLKKNSQKKSLSALSKEAQLVYNNLNKPEFSTDDLCTLNLDSGILLSALTELEIEHIIVSLPGGKYKISDQ